MLAEAKAKYYNHLDEISHYCNLFHLNFITYVKLCDKIVLTITKDE
jgi:hypothetical protein